LKDTLSDCVEHVIPESCGDTKINGFVSIVMSHMLFFELLEWLKLEVSSEMEPKMHGIIKDLSND